jgi:hypothetical protein
MASNHSLTVPSNSRLCSRCREILERYKSTWASEGTHLKAKHHASWTELVAAKNSGCGTCTRLWFIVLKKGDSMERLSRITNFRTEAGWSLHSGLKEFFVAASWTEGDRYPAETVTFCLQAATRNSLTDEDRLSSPLREVSYGTAIMQTMARRMQSTHGV